ncbi:acyl-CoA dehydrogenase family protein [Nocardioides sp. BP30]|uniref:acyl-CoA dehydrogenase family protein n=1 Tax=Nocardioides sp. BP30 TaxID=3036374 RepID=UPI002469951D|nr:acyl-CoA dehydrogenase family protein [Nocardioides sp. BP30]WGL54008.1 acyl-CoA dehydrogenase family protein [Nocardioides sp. BP30]
MDVDQVRDFEASIAAVLRDVCGQDAPAGGSAAVEPRLWAAAVEGGWFDLGAGDELAGLLAAMGQLGRYAADLPLADGYVAARLDEKWASRIGAGDLRVAVGQTSTDDTVPYVECAGTLTHVLVLPEDAGPARLRPVLARVETEGLARPSWSTVTLGPDEEVVELSAEQTEEAKVVLRLALAARAAAAAELTHELAVEHAKTRIQFGKPIGSFGAVQQRTASVAIDVAGARELLQRAVLAHQHRAADRLLSAELATAYILQAARRIQLGSHHTLAAIGYFEEHLGPWLFRRVHADLFRIPLFAPAAGTVGDRLVEGEGGLPEFALDATAEAFRSEVRTVIDGLRGPGGRDDFDADAAVAAFVDKGWYGFGWPEEYGGRRASLSEQVVLHDEMAYSRVPAKWQLSSVMLIGAAIMRFGTEEQKAHYLPMIRRGELRHCLGYSEPDVGSDLASLKTKAVREGDEWVINGQKVWTTRAQMADYVWLATRTDPDAQPRHAGITMFLVPLDTPGITIHPMTSLGSEISCTVFYDDVRVPDSCRVGEVNGGWGVITTALAGERVVMGGIASQLQRQLDDLLDHVRGTDLLGPRGSAARATLTSLVARLQALRALVATAISAQSDAAKLAAPMAGVLGGELAEDWGEAMPDLLGPIAALAGDVPGGGDFETGLRMSVMYVVGGGTNDIQRGMIARALGLPR